MTSLSRNFEVTELKFLRVYIIQNMINFICNAFNVIIVLTCGFDVIDMY